MKVYAVLLRYIGDNSQKLVKIFKTEELAKDYCKPAADEKPSGLCYLKIEEFELEE